MRLSTVVWILEARFCCGCKFKVDKGTGINTTK